MVSNRPASRAPLSGEVPPPQVGPLSAASESEWPSGQQWGWGLVLQMGLRSDSGPTSPRRCSCPAASPGSERPRPCSRPWGRPARPGLRTRQTGIGRRVYPHLRRHSFATYMRRDQDGRRRMGSTELSQVLGHTSTTMIDTHYGNLLDSDIDESVLRRCVRASSQCTTPAGQHEPAVARRSTRSGVLLPLPSFVRAKQLLRCVASVAAVLRFIQSLSRAPRLGEVVCGGELPPAQCGLSLPILRLSAIPTPR
jgi:hypothetical protein